MPDDPASPFTPSALTEGGDLLGEGPVWHGDEAAVSWVDIEGRRLHRLEPATGARRSWSLPDRASAAVPCADGRLLVAFARALAVFDPADDRVETVAELPEPDGHRFNDAKCDPAGRFWVGSMNERDQARTGSLYRFDRRGLVRMAHGIAIGNSLAWSPDGGTLYFADTPTRVIRAWDCDLVNGEIARERIFARVEGPGLPDGAATDRAGFLWSAEWAGARIVRYAPDGTIDRIVPMPVSRPTSLCFGGTAAATMFVTSSAKDCAAEPQAGALFAIEAEVAGDPPPRFSS